MQSQPRVDLARSLSANPPSRGLDVGGSFQVHRRDVVGQGTGCVQKLPVFCRWMRSLWLGCSSRTVAPTGKERPHQPPGTLQPHPATTLGPLHAQNTRFFQEPLHAHRLPASPCVSLRLPASLLPQIQHRTSRQVQPIAPHLATTQELANWILVPVLVKKHRLVRSLQVNSINFLLDDNTVPQHQIEKFTSSSTVGGQLRL